MQEAEDLTPVYTWVDGVEDLESYCPGGYHPTHIGDQYNDRYEIIHKLGYGSYSTVWLTKDLHKKDVVAMKIIVSEYSKETLGTEIKALNQLALGSKSHPGRSYVPCLLDQFNITGPNGEHRCLITKAAGGSVSHAKDECPPYKLSSDVARAISAQALLGLDYIHSCGVVHGDLHTGNILFSYLHPTRKDTAAIYDDIRKPIKKPVERLDGREDGPGVPHYCVLPAPTGKPCHEVVEADARILISDFGEAFFLDQHQQDKELRTPLPLLPPEYIFNDQPLSREVDIWSFGCILYDLLGAYHLFTGFFAGPDDVIIGMIRMLGPIPERW